MKISIIIPLYNCENYVLSALDSIKNQTSRDFEIIIVDDGSSDNSAAVVKEWIKFNPNIHTLFVRQENQGVSAARNKGLTLASGEYIMFCDADDCMHPQLMKVFVDAISGHDYDTIACTFSHDINDLQNITIAQIEECDMKNVYLFQKHSLHFCGFIYKKAILKEHNILFSRDLKYGEDSEFTWKYLCHIVKAGYIDTPLYFYRINESSATHVEKNYSRTQVIDSMIRVGRYFEENGNPFGLQLVKYGVPRAKLSILREFAQSNNRQLYEELLLDERYACDMLNVLKFPSMKIKMACLALKTSTNLFYRLFSR